MAQSSSNMRPRSASLYPGCGPVDWPGETSDGGFLTGEARLSMESNRNPNMSSLRRQSDFLPLCTRGITCNAMRCALLVSGSVSKLRSYLPAQICRRRKRTSLPVRTTPVLLTASSGVRVQSVVGCKQMRCM